MSKKFLSVILVITMAVCLLPTMRGSAEDYTISNALFVTAGTLGISQDMLQWSNVNAPGGYKLEIYTESGTQVYSDTLAVNYTPASEVLTASGTYYFTVYALDLNGSELSSKTSDKFAYTHTHSYEATIIDPTCTEKGYTIYTCSTCGDSYTANETEATGHSWGEVVYTWSDAGKTCTAIRTCEYDETHVEEATATVTDEKTKEATCTEKGETTYTAVFSESWASNRTKVVAESATGHDLSHVEAKDPACTEAGNIEYWYCSNCEKYFSDEDCTAEITDTTKLTLSATGHTYSVKSWSWSSDYTTATATFTCTACGDIQTVEAVVTSEVDGSGNTVYTATIAGTTYTDTQTVAAAPTTTTTSKSDIFTTLSRIQASYTAVNEAIQKANALNPSDYENFSAVTEAIEAVDWSLNVLNQKQVNAYAEAIEEAIENLVPVSTTEEVVEIDEPVEAGSTDVE